MDLKSNEPFWLIKNGIISSYSSLRNDVNTEVLIVGGGITGALMAQQCIQDGNDTILIDKREIANGSSSATTSMLQYEIDTNLYDLTAMIGKNAAEQCYWACHEAIDRLEQICLEVQSNSGFKRKKSLYYATSRKKSAQLNAELNARKEAGFEVEWLDNQVIKDVYNIHHTFGGILSQQGASVDAFKLIHDILNFNIAKGLQVYDKTELLNVTFENAIHTCTLSTGSIIKARKIIYCVGYESQTMIKENFVNLISTYAMVSEVDSWLTNAYKDILLWNTMSPYLYMRTTDDNRMLIGGEDEPFRNASKRDSLLVSKEKKLLKSFHKAIPEASFIPDFVWAGTFGETKDGLPYIGEHSKFPNSYFVLGFGGNGITFSVAGMQMMSSWLKGKEHKLSPYFSFGR